MKRYMTYCSFLLLTSALLLTMLLTLTGGTVEAQDTDADAPLVEASGLETIDTFDTVDAITKNYITTTNIITNPERGPYYHTETHSPNYEPLVSPILPNTITDTSLILRVFYLEDFLDKNTRLSVKKISGTKTYLDLMQDDFDTIRKDRLKVIVRFAYGTNTITNQDAGLSKILTDIGDLSAVLQKNNDVIFAVQAGFLGAWGEWYYTSSEFSTRNVNPNDANDFWHTVSNAQYYTRSLVLAKLINAVASTTTVQVRTPLFKRKMLEQSVAFTPKVVLTPSRVSHHNDCLFSDESDIGTYTLIYSGTYPNSTKERWVRDPSEVTYLANETQLLLMGGEPCTGTKLKLNYVTGVETQLTAQQLCNELPVELEKFHWSYLNGNSLDPDGPLPSMTDQLRVNGCWNQITRKLGYRFELSKGVFPNSVRPGGTFPLSLTLRNAGYAAPIIQRPVELILRKVGSSTPAITYTLKADLRKWLPGTLYSITDTLNIPCNLSKGQYDLLLNLPDPNLRGKPAYSIRFANQVDNADIWESATGYNRLGFSMAITQPVGVVAQYCQDFQGTKPKSNWRYLWNSSAVLSQTSVYTPLVWNTTSSAYNSGTAITTTNLGYGHLKANSGHPGKGITDSVTFDRYVIAAYTVTITGTYAITNSRITDYDKGGGNGAEVCIFTNRTTTIQCLTYDNGGAKIFDRPLGSLKPKDSIFVAVGPRGSAAFDAFTWDFSISISNTVTGASFDEEENSVSLFLPIIAGGN